MGISHSREATSRKDTPAKRGNKHSNSKVATRLDRLRHRGFSMGSKSRSTSAGSTERDADTLMESRNQRKDTSNVAGYASRRRTRSMTMAERAEGDNDVAEDAEMRRIRRRMKGKSREGTHEVEHTETDRTQGDALEMSAPEELAALSAQETAVSAPQGSDRSTNTAMPSTIESQELEGSSAREETASNASSSMHPLLTPAIAASNPFSTSRNPFDLTGEERSRARLQIAQALGERTPQQQDSDPGNNAADPYRPSMLSALLSDILGLRSNQIAAATAASGSAAQSTASHGSRQRIGGTSVIVQGALISRTLSTRAASTSRAEERPNVDAVPVLSEQSHDHRAHREAAPNNPAPLQGAGVEQASMEPQSATIEEQAAMLIRLLSIATAATAASIMSGPHMQQPDPALHEANAQSQGQLISPGAPSPAEPTNAMDRAEPISSAPALATSSFDMTAASASVSVPESVSSSVHHGAWRSASQMYQSWRARFSALRRRLRSRTLPISTNESSIVNERDLAPSLTIQDNDMTNARESSTSRPVAPIAASNQSQRSRMHQEMSSGSLDSLSNMLQEAIRRGVHRASVTNENESNVHDSMDADDAASGGDSTFNAHSTLNAVRGGHLSRGQEGTFDRFLFDLMADLDVAVRRIPTEGDAARNTDAVDDGGATLHRGRDLRDGQLSFFRSFTFPATSTSDDNNEQGSIIPPELLPCIVVGVRSLGVGQRPRGPSLATASFQGQGQAQEVASELSPSADEAHMTTPLPSSNEHTAAINTGNASLSRFLLFVSGGHYPPQHPLFHSSSEEAARDLMVLIEFLGAMTSIQMKPPTVTKEEIEKSDLQMVNGGLDAIANLFKEKKIMENTSERCLICLEDWKEVDENRRLLDCAHLFHAPCIDQWLTASNNSCPLCRRQAVSQKTNGTANTPSNLQ